MRILPPLKGEILLRNFLNRYFTLVFMLPVIVLLLTLIIYPMFYGFYISLFDTNLLNKWNFVGLKNYTNLLSNKEFQSSLAVNLKYILGVVTGHVLIGGFLAVQLNKAIKARAFWRALLMLPWLIPEVVWALLSKWILNPQYGVLNYTLMKLGILDQSITWLGGLTTSLPTVIFTSILKGYPFVMAMMLAVLQTVPGDIYEAAAVDGCKPVRAFWAITVPTIIPVISIALILDTVNWFKHYTMVSIMTGGGPAKSTSLVSLTIYKTAFESFKFGSAGSMAVIVFAICYFFNILYRRLDKINE